MNLWLTLAVNSIALGGLLFLLSSGFSLIFGLMRIPNLTHGALFMLGAYFGVTFLRLGINFWVAALLIALIDFPKFSLPDLPGSLGRIANALESLADRQRAVTDPQQTLAAQLQLPLDSKQGSVAATEASVAQPVTDQLATHELTVNQPKTQKD